MERLFVIKKDDLSQELMKCHCDSITVDTD